MQIQSSVHSILHICNVQQHSNLQGEFVLFFKSTMYSHVIISAHFKMFKLQCSLPQSYNALFVLTSQLTLSVSNSKTESVATQECSTSWQGTLAEYLYCTTVAWAGTGSGHFTTTSEYLCSCLLRTGSSG